MLNVHFDMELRNEHFRGMIRYDFKRNLSAAVTSKPHNRAVKDNIRGVRFNSPADALEAFEAAQEEIPKEM